MKPTKLALSLVTASAALLAVATAQVNNLKVEEDAEPTQQKLIKVCTLSSVEANQEFQRNVQIMQSKRAKAVELNTKISEANDPIEKARLEGELKVHLEQLNADNKKMLKTYGFSLTRNYTLVVEKAHVYMFVSDKEAAEYEANLKKTGGTPQPGK